MPESGVHWAVWAIRQGTTGVRSCLRPWSGIGFLDIIWASKRERPIQLDRPLELGPTEREVYAAGSMWEMNWPATQPVMEGSTLLATPHQTIPSASTGPSMMVNSAP